MTSILTANIPVRVLVREMLRVGTAPSFPSPCVRITTEISTVFLNCFSTLLFFGESLSLNPELTDWLGWLASELQGSFCLRSRAMLIGAFHCSWVLYGYQVPKLRFPCLLSKSFANWAVSPALIGTYLHPLIMTKVKRMKTIYSQFVLLILITS